MSTATREPEFVSRNPERATQNPEPATRNPQRGTRNPPGCYCIDLPLTDYHDAWDMQIAIVNAKKQGILAADVILLLEHFPVFTLGRRGGLEHLTVSKSFLETSNIDVVHVERGGNITYHGPGQIVVYPILDLNRRRLGITDLVSGMEEIMIRTARDFGVQAGCNPKNRGVWVGNQKLGSIGIAVRRGISYHGFAFNVHPSLTHFDWIHPCGLTDIGVTSLKKELGTVISIEDVRLAITHHMEKVFDLELNQITRDRLNELIQ